MLYELEQLLPSRNKMPTLSIIACKMLEDELVHLLSKDGDINELVLIDAMDGSEHLGLSGKLRSQGRSHIVMSMGRIQERPKVHGRLTINEQLATQEPPIRRNLRGSASFLRGFIEDCRCVFKKISGRKEAGDLVVVVRMQRIALHSDLERLKRAVSGDIRQLSAFSDGIMVFYGKCGNSLADLQNELEGLACPLYFLTDGLGERVDDCIATALGGNENYDRTLAEHQDVAVFMTPMWAANWRMSDGSGKSAGLDKSRDMGAMLKGKNFSKVARIDIGLSYEPGFEDNVDDFAGTFDLERIELSGSTVVVDRCYHQAKDRLLQAHAASPRTIG